MSSNPPAISDQPVLKLLNVESAYGPIKAIRGVSLQVRRGEIATVLGSNGAGKSTVLKTISGIIDPRVHDPAYDLTVCKKGPSIFFNTGVAEYFNKERVDTVIVTGCNTSGCIRGTALDSFSLRYRTLVPEDCVGDIEEQPHRDNLRDIGRRYVDVSDLASVLAYLEEWRKSNA